MQQIMLIEGLAAGNQTDHAAAGPQPGPERGGAARMRYADRSQVTMQLCSLDELLPADHPARTIWQAVESLDLSAFEEAIEAREHAAGRPANDVRVMVGLWLWAAVDNVGSGRQLAELCRDHVAYRWMCGTLSVNYHTLNDFRTGHETALDDLFTQVLGRLMHAGLVKIDRITQDGLRVRASAGRGSFKKRAKLEQFLKEAEEHLTALKAQNQEGSQEDRTRRAALARFAAQDRLERVRAALKNLSEIEAVKATLPNKDRREAPARASLTDPEARKMKMPNGGFDPAYNVQLAADPDSRAIVGVSVCPNGGDAPLSEPLREQVNDRAAAAGSSQTVKEHVMDGGYVNLGAIDRAEAEGVSLYMPVPQPNKEGIDRFAPRANDSAAVAAWRRRMGSEMGAAIYQQRASTSETINADLRTWRGLNRFLVRGLSKVQCVALWSALAYNLMHFAAAIVAA